MIARRETSGKRETLIYKLRDKELTGAHDDQQTPTLILGKDTHSEVTAVTALPPWYAIKRRRSDPTKRTP
jgi:hypothetical protein